MDKKFSEHLNELNTKFKNSTTDSPERIEAFQAAILPFNWYLSKDSFPPIFQQIKIVDQLISTRGNELSEALSMSGVPKFLKGVLEQQQLDGSGWFFLAASAELAAALDLKKIKAALEQTDHSADEINAIAQLTSNLEEINSSKHDAYWKLRSLGAEYIDQIDLVIEQLHPDDQDFIMHALDAFTNDTGVIQFFKNYIGRVQSDFLKEAAEKYLSKIYFED